MTEVNVLFLHSCGADLAGERKPIDAKRAKRLEWTGYVRILDAPESAETATQIGPRSRGTKPERRG